MKRKTFERSVHFINFIRFIYCKNLVKQKTLHQIYNTVCFWTRFCTLLDHSGLVRQILEGALTLPLKTGHLPFKCTFKFDSSVKCWWQWLHTTFSVTAFGLCEHFFSWRDRSDCRLYSFWQKWQGFLVDGSWASTCFLSEPFNNRLSQMGQATSTCIGKILDSYGRDACVRDFKI